MSVEESKSATAPSVGTSAVPSDTDVCMMSLERVGRVRKQRKRSRERLAKIRRRMANRKAMSGVIPASSSSGSPKSVRFNLEPKVSN